MKDTDYAFCVARIRANEKKLLDSSFINKLIDCESFDSALRLLSDVGWTGETVGEIIGEQNASLWKLISESVPDKTSVNCLCILNDFFNIKCAVKCAFTGEDPVRYYIKPSTLDLKELTRIIQSKDFSLFNDTVFGPCAKEAYELACKTENGQNAEIIIDRATLNTLIYYSEKQKNSLFAEIADFIIDTSNIKTALRCLFAEKNPTFVNNAISECRHFDRKALISRVIDGEEALLNFLMKTRYYEGADLFKKSPVLYDKWCDEYIVKAVGKAKYTAFGFDPVCAYYYARLNEIKNVRIILTSIQSGVPSDKIKERVRSLYV